MRSSSAKASQKRAPAVSVVIKSYNHAKYIGQTLESVLSQSFQDFEIIVTDDGSTDGTPDVVRSVRDQRIKLEVLPRNTGLSRAMNAACARAQGRYLAILNSDDYALAGRLAAQVAYLDQHPDAGAVFTAVNEVSETGQPRARNAVFAIPEQWPDHSRARWLRQFFRAGNCLCAPSAMLRAAALAKIGQYDPRLTNLQDLDMWVRLAAQSEIGFLCEPLTAFRVRAGARNLSAGRPDTIIRSQFEFAMILRRYADMDIGLIRDIFAGEEGLAGIRTDGDKRLFLAELACAMTSPPHRLFGLATYFAAAADAPVYDRLRALTGSVDVFQTLRAGAAMPAPAGGAVPDGISLWLIADGRVIEPVIAGPVASVTIPAGTRNAWLGSPIRAARPGDDDQRSLGVGIHSIELDNHTDPAGVIDLEDPALDAGFYSLEQSGASRWRWARPHCPLPREWYMGFSEDVTLRICGDFGRT